VLAGAHQLAHAPEAKVGSGSRSHRLAAQQSGARGRAWMHRRRASMQWLCPPRPSTRNSKPGGAAQAETLGASIFITVALGTSTAHLDHGARRPATWVLPSTNALNRRFLVLRSAVHQRHAEDPGTRPFGSRSNSTVAERATTLRLFDERADHESCRPFGHFPSHQLVGVAGPCGSTTSVSTGLAAGGHLVDHRHRHYP